EAAIAQLSPAELAGVIASVPLAQQTQEMLRAIAFRQAEQRLLEHFALQADDRSGGSGSVARLAATAADQPRQSHRGRLRHPPPRASRAGGRAVLACAGGAA